MIYEDSRSSSTLGEQGNCTVDYCKIDMHCTLGREEVDKESHTRRGWCSGRRGARGLQCSMICMTTGAQEGSVFSTFISASYTFVFTCLGLRLEYFDSRNPHIYMPVSSKKQEIINSFGTHHLVLDFFFLFAFYSQRYESQFLFLLLTTSISI